MDEQADCDGRGAQDLGSICWASASMCDGTPMCASLYVCCWKIVSKLSMIFYRSLFTANAMLELGLRDNLISLLKINEISNALMIV